MKNEVREIKLDEINILCIIRDLLKNIWVILLAAAAGWLAAAGVMSLLYVPEFTAQATLAVSAKGDSSAYSSLSLTNQMHYASRDGWSLQRSLRQQRVKRKDCRRAR